MIRKAFVALSATVLVAAAGLSAGTAFAANAIPGPRAGDETPVVVIVLDELPTTSLLRPDERIDANRFPAIAGFANGATWYRDNTAAGDFTAWAIPPIFTGNLTNQRVLPTAAAQPGNIFNLLGPGRRVHVKEDLTELCNRRICPDGSQGGAEGVTLANEFIKAKFGNMDVASVKRWTKGIPAGGSTLSVIHLTLPHQPHRFTPDGLIYPGGPLGFTQGGGVKGWSVPEPGIALVQQRHLLQLGYTDRLVGRMLGRVRANGDFNRAMIVLTADHGFAFDADKSRRDSAPDNLAGTVNPPLIVKYPGQKTGEISTAATQSIDIVPTITRQLGVENPYPTMGVPLGEADDDRVMTVSKDSMKQISATAGEIRSQRKRILALQTKRLGAGGLWTLGPRPSLIGTRPGKGAMAAGATVRIDDPVRLTKVRPASGKVPALVSAVVRGIRPGKKVAIVLNGKVRATTRTFRHAGAVRFGAMLPPSKMKKGSNSVSVRVVRGNRLLRLKRLS